MRSIRFQLVSLLFVTLLPAFVMLLLLANLEGQRAATDTANESLAIARLLRGQFGSLVDSSREKLELLVHDDMISEGTPTECVDRLEELFPLMSGYTGFWVADSNGDLVCAVTVQGSTSQENPTPGMITDVGGNPQFERALETGRFVSAGLRTGQITGRTVFGFAMPVVDEAGNVVRVLGTGRDVGTLNRELIATDFPNNAILVLLDGTGRIALQDPPEATVIGSQLPAFTQIQQQLAEGGRSGFVAREESGDEELNYVWVAAENDVNSVGLVGDPGEDAVSPPPFYALVGYTEDRATGSLWRALRAMLTGFGITKIAALLVAFFAAEWLIVRRIKQLSLTARQMREGDLSARTGMKPKSGEIGELGQALDSLAASLQAREIENKRLIKEVESLNNDLEQKFNQRTEQLQRANKQLLSSQMELRQLSLQLMRMTEHERTRISREIHDQLGQSLTAIKMELRNAQRRLESDPEAASRTLDSATEQVNEMVTIVRRIAANLRPGVLDDFGLAAAIDWHVQDYREKTGIQCETDIAVDESLLNSNITTSAYRITQEALTNVARHAEATQVSIRGRTTSNEFIMEIQDNGKGFAARDASDDGTRPRSLGMLGMQERAAELGGAVTVNSKPGEGTIVRLAFPIAVHSDAEVEAMFE